MNQNIMNAFFDELEKIADWSLAGPQQMNAYSGAALRRAGPHGQHASPTQLVQAISNKEQAANQVRMSSEARRMKMQQMLESGQWNPATHKVDMQGNLVPKRQAPVRAASTTSTVAQSTPQPAVGPKGTAIVNNPTAATRAAPAPAARPAAGAARPASGATRAAQTASKSSRLGKVMGKFTQGGLAKNLGRFGRLGVLGLAGYGAANALSS